MFKLLHLIMKVYSSYDKLNLTVGENLITISEDLSRMFDEIFSNIFE